MVRWGEDMRKKEKELLETFLIEIDNAIHDMQSRLYATVHDEIRKLFFDLFGGRYEQNKKT